jgi:hypothetical protein
MGYSAHSYLSRIVCETIGWSFEIHPIKALRRGRQVFVTGTLLHPSEWRQLKGHDGMTLPDGSVLVVTRVPTSI